LTLLALAVVVALLAIAPRWSSASEQAAADPAATAARDKVDDLLDGAVPVPKLSTTTSRTYRRADGSYVSRVFAQAPTYRDAWGIERKVDDTLRPVAGGFETTADKWSTFLPSSLTEPVRIRRGDRWVSMQLRGAAGSGRVDGPTITYPDAFPDVGAEYRVSSGAVGERLHLRGGDAPASFVFDVRAGAGVRAGKQRNGTIALTDADGEKVFGLSPSYAFADLDPTATQEVSTDLAATADGWRITLSVDEGWLRDKLADGPVTIDPTVELQGATKDCALTSDTPTLSFCSDGQLWIGYDGDHDHHALVKWDLSAIPKDAVALWGDVGLNHPSEWGIGVSKQLTVHRMTRDWTNGASWNSYDGTHAWTTPGGDFDATPAATATVPANHGGWTDWSTTGLVQHWIDGSQPNYGVAIKDKAGPLVAGEEDYFSTEGTIPAQAPELDIVWTTRTGNPDFYTHESQGLDAKTNLGVNAANGNLWLATNDIAAAGTGLDLRFDHYYNSLLSSSEIQSLGIRATASLGRDVHLNVFDADSIGFSRGDGVTLPFLGAQTSGTTISYTTPAELGAATLTKSTTTNKYTLHLPAGLPSYPGTDLTLSFDSAGKLLDAKDPAGHTIALSYYAQGAMEFPALGGITDTNNVFWDVDRGYIGGERIIDILDPAGHHTLYEYANGSDDYLIKVTRADATISRYAYDTSHRLKSMTTPDGNVTLITYNGTTSQIASVVRTNNPTHTTGPTTTFAYSAPTTPCQSTNFDFAKTVVNRPDATSTTYCANDHAQITYDTDNPTTATPSGEWYDLHDQYTQGTGTHSITFTGADKGAGVKKMALEQVGGSEIASTTLPCDPRNATNPIACPHAATATATFNPSGIAEGVRTFRQTTTDYAGNKLNGTSWSIFVDRTAPGPVTGVDGDFNPDANVVDVSWDVGADPALAGGSPGSGTATFAYRYHVGTQPWTAWTTTTYPGFSAAGVTTGAQLSVEVTEADAVGNTSTVATATISAAAAPNWSCEDAEEGAYPSRCIADAEPPMDDSDPDSNVTLVPEQGQQSFTGAVDRRFRVRVRTDSDGIYSNPFERFSTVRTGANSWAIGQAPDNSIVDGEYEDDRALSGNPSHPVTWVRGFVSGFSGGHDGNQCGWVYANNLVADFGTPDITYCGTIGMEIQHFSAYTNCPQFTQDVGPHHCNHGTATTLVAASRVCANIGLDQHGNSTGCAVGGVNNVGELHTGDCFEWRYVTNDGGDRRQQYVLGKLRSRQNTEASWVFIRRTALKTRTSQLPNITSSVDQSCDS
jgi:YD repeat-containing protein